MSGGLRYGAGRPAFRPCDAHHLSLDVRRLAREGLLGRSGWSGWTWRRDGEQVGHIGLHIDAGRSVRFDFTQTRQGERRPVSVTAWLDSTPCTYGGSRWWWRCPNCSRRCARLFIVTGGLGVSVLPADDSPVAALVRYRPVLATHAEGRGRARNRRPGEAAPASANPRAAP